MREHPASTTPEGAPADPAEPDRFTSSLDAFTGALGDLAGSNRELATEVKGSKSNSAWSKWLTILVAVGLLALISNAIHPWFGATKHLVNSANANTATLNQNTTAINEIDQTFKIAERLTDPQAQAKQAQAGAVLIECSVFRAMAQFAHVAYPKVTYTFPAEDGCPPIQISPAGVRSETP